MKMWMQRNDNIAVWSLANGTSFLLSLLLLISLSLALLLSQQTLASDFAVSEKNDEQTRQYYRSRFGQLTSDVWRYKQAFVANDLTPVANNNPAPELQPKRDRPGRTVLNASGTKLYVTLQGTELEPSNQIAVIDTATNDMIKRIKVGSRPYQPVLHPDGRFIVVSNELSNYLSVIDTLTDENVGQIPLDYYGQGVVFNKTGTKAWVAIRYLGQVLTLDIVQSGRSLTGQVQQVGGFSEDKFYGHQQKISTSLRNELLDRGITKQEISQMIDDGVGGVNGILRARCKGCHAAPAGGFQSGADKTINFLSAVENSIAGKPLNSPLLRAVIPASMGGFGDVKTTPEFHPAGALFKEGEPELDVIIDWIKTGTNGPGISVGNPGSHPKDLVLSADEKHLFVGNTGTMDISIIDTEANQEVAGLFIQNVANFVTIFNDIKTDKDHLIALTMGAGFGAPKERDPFGGETWDRDNAAAQFTVLRDPKTSDAYPWQEQYTMGPFDAIDGTWNFKMRDIQNDIVAFDLSQLSIPSFNADKKLDYLLRANKYEAHDSWVRYTSDTAEATTGDIKGDIPPELQRVPGAMPEWAVIEGDRMFVSMSGSFELVEWKINVNADDPAEKLVPVKVYSTG